MVLLYRGIEQLFLFTYDVMVKTEQKLVFKIANMWKILMPIVAVSNGVVDTYMQTLMINIPNVYLLNGKIILETYITT